MKEYVSTYESNVSSKIVLTVDSDIKNYLVKYDLTIDNIYDILSIIEHFFTDSKFDLKVERDIEEGTSELFIYIDNNFSNDEAYIIYLKCLKELIENYYDIFKFMNISPKYN